MAKKRTKGATSSNPKKTLEKLDREIIALVNERLAIAKDEILPEKREINFAGMDEVIDAAIKTSKGPASEPFLRHLLRELWSESRRLAHPIRVSFLGPKYSYSYLATVERFGSSAELTPVGTIAAVFESILRGQAEFGLVPIENSTDGRIVDTLGMFVKLPVQICGEVNLTIHHQLLGKGHRDKLAEVYSKPQAISQCRGWLAKHLPNVRLVEMSSTTAAAEVAAAKPGAAAIASRQAGMEYGLEVLAENIEDNRNNVTRFAVIGETETKRSGNDKTSLLMQIPHQPGALADAMNVFKRGKLNLTWIESFPIPDAQNEYLFFVEVEGHKSEAKIKRALEALEKKTVRLNILGSYAKSDIVA